MSKFAARPSSLRPGEGAGGEDASEVGMLPTDLTPLDNARSSPPSSVPSAA